MLDPHQKFIGRYELVRELARGGMGAVYVARHVDLDRHVALKVMLTDASDGDGLQRFETEAQAVGQLTHPNIVRIHEAGSAPCPYLVMDLIDGASLQQELKKGGPLDPRQAAQLTRDLASAMAHAHERGVLHRDLKPANVLWSQDGRALITDFGLAKTLDNAKQRLTQTGEILGTPSYMPPEQAAGEVGAIGPRADVYSLGATFYALLTGRPPFEGQTAINIISKVLRQEPTAPGSLMPEPDADLETICLKCLEKEQADRYQTMRELEDDLNRYLNGEAILAQPVTAKIRLRKFVRRKPKLAASIAGLVLVAPAIAVGASVVWSSTASEPKTAPPSVAPVETHVAVATPKQIFAAAWAQAKEHERSGGIEGYLAAVASYDEAQAALESAGEKASVELYLARGYARSRACRAEDVQRDVNAVLELDPASPDAALLRLVNMRQNPRARPYLLTGDEVVGLFQKHLESLRGGLDAPTDEARALARARVGRAWAEQALAKLRFLVPMGPRRLTNVANTARGDQHEVGAESTPLARAIVARVDVRRLAITARSNRTEKALREAREAVDAVNDEDPRSVQGYLARSEFEALHRSWAASAEAAQQAIRVDPSETDGHTLLATALIEQGRYADALAPLAHVRDQDPTSRAARVEWARCSLYAGDCRAAAEEYRKLAYESFRGGRDNRDAHRLMYAIALYGQGDEWEKVNTLVEEFKSDPSAKKITKDRASFLRPELPKHPEGGARRAALLASWSLAQVAFELWRAEEAKVSEGRGSAKLRGNYMRKARENIVHAVRFAPESSRLRHLEYEIRVAQRRFAEALTAIEAAVATRPTDPDRDRRPESEYNYERGLVLLLLRARRFAEARDGVARCREIAARLRLGGRVPAQLATMERDAREGLGEAPRGAPRIPSDAEPGSDGPTEYERLVKVAVRARNNGRFKISINNYTAALEIFESARGYSGRGFVRLLFDLPRLALADADQALKLDESVPEAHYVRARALLMLGHPAEEALSSATRAIELNAEWAIHYDVRAEAYDKLGRAEEAAADRAAAKRLRAR